MSTLSVVAITGVTTLSGGGFDLVGNTSNAALTAANLALLTANVANTTANSVLTTMSTFTGTQNGQIIMTTNTAVPYGGYLLCDGSVYNRSSYPNLANVSNIAVLSGTFLANMGYSSAITAGGPGDPSGGSVSSKQAGVSVSNNGIIFNQLGVYTASGSTDNGLTWRLLHNPTTPITYTNVAVGFFHTHGAGGVGSAGSAGGGVTYHPTIAFNGTNYVAGNMWSTTAAAGVRYGSNAFALTSFTTTNVNFPLDGVVWNGRDKFIAVGQTGYNVAAYSSDGITWTVGGGIANSTTTSGVGYKRLAYGNNAVVVGTSNTVSQANIFSFPIIRYSLDNATTFSTATQPSGFGVNSGFNSSNTCIRYVGYINNQFIAVDHAGAIANSPNGVTWSLVAGANTLNNFLEAMNPLTDYQSAASISTISSSHNMDYLQGYYVYGSLYSTDLVNWKRFPQQSAKKSAITPTGIGAVLPTSNVYYFAGATPNFGDGGCGSTPEYMFGGYWNPYPFTGSQFSVPYLTDEVSGMVKYYIKT